MEIEKSNYKNKSSFYWYNRVFNLTFNLKLYNKVYPSKWNYRLDEDNINYQEDYPKFTPEFNFNDKNPDYHRRTTFGMDDDKNSNKKIMYVLKLMSNITIN